MENKADGKVADQNWLQNDKIIIDLEKYYAVLYNRVVYWPSPVNRSENQNKIFEARSGTLYLTKNRRHSVF